MDNMPATTPSNDSRRLNKDAPFHLDPSYYTEQLEKELAARTRELRMQMAGFEQLQDLFNNLVDTLASCESELEKTRGAIRDHEKLAVDQQMVVDEFAEFKRLLAHVGTDYDGLLEDLKKSQPDVGQPKIHVHESLDQNSLAGPTYHHIEDAGE